LGDRDTDQLGVGQILGKDPRGLVLRRAYAEMRDGNPSPPGSRPVINQSWARSAMRQPSPEHGLVVVPLLLEELALRRHMSLLAGIGPDVCAGQASKTGLLMVVTDADGRVLWRAGDRKDLDRGDRDGHGVGACLTEHTFDTSGVSLALAAGHPVVVCGPEHYCPAQHDLVCAGAPTAIRGACLPPRLIPPNRCTAPTPGRTRRTTRTARTAVPKAGIRR
jgi:transcriptional regulator of acetoin/glycerol metabolism